MKIKKLNTNGIAHQFALIAVVVIFAVSGVGYMVASHADACNMAKLPVSYVSGANTKANCAASLVTCTVNGMPADATHNKTVRPVLSLTNTGKKTAKLNVFVKRINYDDSGHVVAAGTDTFRKNIKTGQTGTKNLRSLKARYAAATTSVEYRVSFAKDGNTACSATTKLPANPKPNPIILAPAQ